MNRITDVVKALIIINVIMFIGTEMIMGDSRYALALFYPSSDSFMPFQIVSHMFMHANFNHILFNMLMLFFLGPAVESRWGSKRFLFYYLFAGLGSAFLQLAATYYDINSLGFTNAGEIPMLGASGAIMGVAVAFAMLFPNTELQLIFPPIPIKAKYFVPIIVGIDLISGIGRFQPGIANFAHLGGALFGFLLIIYWNKFGSRL